MQRENISDTRRVSSFRLVNSKELFEFVKDSRDIEFEMNMVIFNFIRPKREILKEID